MNDEISKVQGSEFTSSSSPWQLVRRLGIGMKLGRCLMATTTPTVTTGREPDAPTAGIAELKPG